MFQIARRWEKNAGTNGYADVSENHQKYVYLYSYVPQCDCYLCALIPQKVITKQADSVKNITLFIVLIASIIAILYELKVWNHRSNIRHTALS
jgi:methyl-accepting chemotaxis protein